MGAKIEVIKKHGVYTYEYPDFTVELNTYLLTTKDKTFILNDHDEYALVSPKEMLKYDIVPADIQIVKDLIKNDNLH